MPIEYAIGLAFLAAGLAFLASRLRDRLSYKDRIPFLERTVSILEEENAELKKTIATLQDEHAELKTRLAEHEDQKRILARYTFDESTSTYTNETEHRFCSKCLLKDHPAESPLKPTKHGWQCAACNAIFNDPNNPPPQMVFHRT